MLDSLWCGRISSGNTDLLDSLQVSVLSVEVIAGHFLETTGFSIVSFYCLVIECLPFISLAGRQEGWSFRQSIGRGRLVWWPCLEHQHQRCVEQQGVGGRSLNEMAQHRVVEVARDVSEVMSCPESSLRERACHAGLNSVGWLGLV
jgi:hypothetical protein